MGANEASQPDFAGGPRAVEVRSDSRSELHGQPSSELILGVVGCAGSGTSEVARQFEKAVATLGYKPHIIGASKAIADTDHATIEAELIKGVT